MMNLLQNQSAALHSTCPTAHKPGNSAKQRLCCWAAKTTRGRSSDITSSSSGAEEEEQRARRPLPRPKSVQEHARDVQQRLSGIVQYLTPKQEGDAGDVFMILVSLAVFIYLAMQLYRMYYWAYLQLGVMDMMS